MHPIDLYIGLIPAALAFVAIVLAFIWFAIWGHRRPGDYEHEPFFYRFWRANVSPFAKALNSLGVGPNTVTLASLVFSAILAGCIVYGFFLAAFWLMLVTVSCDTIDGFLARMQGTTSQAGAFLDSFFDRLSEGLTFGAFAIYGAGEPLMWAAIGAMISSYAISYARARAEGLGVDLKVGWMQRPLRMTITLIITFAAAVLTLLENQAYIHDVLTAGCALIGVWGFITASRRAHVAFTEL